MEREEVRFPVGGEQCAALLVRPRGGDGQVPAVVLGTGISCVRDQGLDAFAERFAAAGYAALAFDYRHFGTSDGEPRRLVSNALQREDWRAALSFCRSLEGVDASRVALWGYSLGGAHVQFLAATEGGIGAMICVAPVVNQARTIFHAGGPWHLARLIAAGYRDRLRALRRADRYRIPVVGPPGSLAVLPSPEAVEGAASMTPPDSTWRNDVCGHVGGPTYRLERKVRGIACPALYCITEEDDVNPPKLGKRAAARVADAELRLYPGGHFAHSQDDVFERMVTDQVDFLNRRLDPHSSSAL
jgi:dienelactone hydrolase